MTVVFAAANGFELRLPRLASQAVAISCRNYQIRTSPFVCRSRAFHGSGGIKMGSAGSFDRIRRGRRPRRPVCRNYQIRTNLFVSTVCRFAERHAGSAFPTIRLS